MKTCVLAGACVALGAAAAAAQVASPTGRAPSHEMHFDFTTRQPIVVVTVNGDGTLYPLKFGLSH